ncbi:MAG: glycosyltransferase [Mesonia hippocampi]|uniref:glycosyltransferase n=1 Tax=Mesonia hippocampi TaxID=1628250 RepID=UPI003F94C2B6
MKVLTVVNSLNMGGVENTLLSCLPYLQSNGVEIVMCCFKANGELEDEFRNYGVNIVYIKKTGSIILDCIQTIKIINKYNINIVHSRFSYTSGGFMLASFLKKVSGIVSIHSSSPVGLKTRQGNYFKNLILKGYLYLHKRMILIFAKKIIGHSENNLNINFRNWRDNSKFKVIYNGVDFENLYGKPSILPVEIKSFIKNSEFTIVHIGSMRLPKNHIYLLKVFSKLRPRINNYKLILVGSGELRMEIEQFIKDSDLEDNVYLVGFDSNVTRYLSAADMFFFPSTIEGFANVLVEAQAMEVPILTSNLPVFNESVYKGYKKYFFNPLSIEQGIISFKKLKKEIESGRVKKLAADAKEYVVNSFDIATMSIKLTSLYDHLKIRPKEGIIENNNFD